jgi:dUTP pyrophosphatase
MKIEVKRLPHGADLPLPAYATTGAAGLDICAAVERDIVILPGERAHVPTGFSYAIPEGYEGQVRPRSGLALRHGLMLPNAPGTIDSDYRGELGVILINMGKEPVRISRGDRIAQLVIAPVTRAELTEVSDVGATERGDGGFGSTGGLRRASG